MASVHKQYLRAKSEVETSIVNVKIVRDQWLAATTNNPTNLTKKDIDYLGKAFKNRLLTVKWDCEDLEELISMSENDLRGLEGQELQDAKNFLRDSEAEVGRLVKQLDDVDSSSRLFNKHGISPYLSSDQSAVSSAIPQYQNEIVMLDSIDYRDNTLMMNGEPEEIQFDKNQLESTATVFNNALYDHFEQSDDRLQKGFNSPSQVFNNLSRPVTNVYMNPSEDEVILDMLETEYSPSEQPTHSRISHTIRKLIVSDRNRFLSTLAFLFSFPILLMIFLVV